MRKKNIRNFSLNNSNSNIDDNEKTMLTDYLNYIINHIRILIIIKSFWIIILIIIIYYH
jgi:hypothetical protein